ncbi:MAG: GNAT family N-acetyltransferase [Pseudomonadales bacterium]|jgi:hypothetical protein|nr:GNAT family N-acetyltransferase [Pseudomonadales bacterium]
MTDENPDNAHGFEVRPYRPRDYAAVSNLFSAIFKQPMSTQFHAWKYRPGNSAATVVFKDGELVAHYGGVGAAVTLRGEDSRAVQIVDVMVSPSVRRAGRKNHPFFLAVNCFRDYFVGEGRSWLFGYGLPNERTMRHAMLLGIYAPVGRLMELVWDSAALARAPLPWWRLDSVTRENFPFLAKELDALWARMRQDLGQACAVIKDAKRLYWRYLEHPEREYQITLARNRFTGRALGLFVYRVEAEQLFLLDLVAPKANLAPLLGLAAHEAQRRQLPTLKTWCSKTWIDWLPYAQATVTELPIIIPADTLSHPGPEMLQDRWWLLPGDTDFL